MKRTDKGTLHREYESLETSKETVTIPLHCWKAQRETLLSLLNEIEEWKAAYKIEKARANAAQRKD
jgi:hypothetical protein